MVSNLSCVGSVAKPSPSEEIGEPTRRIAASFGTVSVGRILNIRDHLKIISKRSDMAMQLMVLMFSRKTKIPRRRLNRIAIIEAPSDEPANHPNPNPNLSILVSIFRLRSLSVCIWLYVYIIINEINSFFFLLLK